MALYLWIAIRKRPRRRRALRPGAISSPSTSAGPFPQGTLIINVTGSFAIGFFATLTQPPDGRWAVGPEGRQFFMIIVGGFTTFSAFSLQTFRLAEAGDLLQAATSAPRCILPRRRVAGPCGCCAGWCGEGLMTVTRVDELSRYRAVANCGQRSIFQKGRMFKVNETCPSCGLRFEKGDGAASAAPFVINYGITSFGIIIPVVVLYALADSSAVATLTLSMAAGWRLRYSCTASRELVALLVPLPPG